MRLLFTSLLLLSSSYISAGEFSKQSKIGKVQLDANSNKLYVYPTSGTWTNSDACPYVLVTSSMSGFQGFMSMALAAKMSKTEVKFFGDCNNTTNSFDAHSIYVM